MDKQIIDSMLQQIAEICNRYAAQSQLLGENFNIFKVIRMTTNEVKVHSRFVAELLNPQGCHGQKDLFLKYFLSHIDAVQPDFDTQTASVQIEKYIGRKSTDGTEGGQIDILITDGARNCILIENKINAKDEDKQLVRYDNYCKKEGFKEYRVFYLTLDGKGASDKSTKYKDVTELKKGKHYFTISYENEIINWLEECCKELHAKPMLKEGITHYINLIKYLVHKTTNPEMNEELKAILLSSSDNLKAACSIQVALNDAKSQVQWNFWQKLEKALQAQGLKIENNEQKATRASVENFYANNKTNYPGLWIKIFEKNNISIHWGAEVESNFYTGFTIEKDGKGGISNISECEEYREFVKALGYVTLTDKMDFSSAKKAWWLGWKYSKCEMNFRNFESGDVSRLVDEIFLDKITSDIAQEAKQDIDRLKENCEKDDK